MGAAAQKLPTSAADVDDDLIRLSFGCSVKEINESERWADFVLSTDAIDSYGEVVVQDWDLTRYEANPVVLFGHRSWDLPIGHAENVRVEKRKLLARLYFVNEKANPLAEQIWQGIVQQSIRAVSVGFRSKAGSAKEIDGAWTYILTGNELIEVSVVPIGANPEAVALRSKSMNVVRALSGVPANNNAGTSPGKAKPMFLKTILPLLALAATATEDEAVAEVSRLKNFERETLGATSTKSAGEAIASVQKANARAAEAEANVAKLVEATGAKSVDGALGAIAAGLDSAKALKEQTDRNDALERAKLISEAKAAKKLTPHAEKGLEGKSLDFVKQFLALQAPNPLLEDDDVEQPEAKTKGGEPTWNGKTWKELSAGEKHQLFHSNKSLYDAMKAAANKAA